MTRASKEGINITEKDLRCAVQTVMRFLFKGKSDSIGELKEQSKSKVIQKKNTGAPVFRSELEQFHNARLLECAVIVSFTNVRLRVYNKGDLLLSSRDLNSCDFALQLGTCLAQNSSTIYFECDNLNRRGLNRLLEILKDMKRYFDNRVCVILLSEKSLSFELEKLSEREFFPLEPVKKKMKADEIEKFSSDVQKDLESENIKSKVELFDKEHKPVNAKNSSKKEAFGLNKVYETLQTRLEDNSLQEDETLHNVKGTELMENERLQMDNKTLERNNETLQISKESLQKANETLTRNNETLQMDNETLQKDNETLQNGKYNYLRDIETLQEDNETRLKENYSLQEGKKALQIENETIVKVKERLQMENDTLQKDNETLVQDKNRLQLDNAALQENNKTDDMDNSELDIEKSVSDTSRSKRSGLQKLWESIQENKKNLKCANAPEIIKKSIPKLHYKYDITRTENGRVCFSVNILKGDILQDYEALLFFKGHGESIKLAKINAFENLIDNVATYESNL